MARDRTTPPTFRQKQALALALAYGDDRAAMLMGISSQTVKNHHQHLYRRLGVETRSQAAIALGWLVFPPGLVPSRRKNRRYADG